MSSMMCGMLLGAGVVSKKTYVEDIFSNYLWKGNATARSINNGINMSESGGMTWIKARSDTKGHILNDTARGAGNRLGTNDYSASASGTAWLSSFNSNGFSIGTDGDVNENNETFSSWSFRKSPGFFTCLTYTGTGVKRTVSHDLGCQPGLIIIKRTDDTGDWQVWHKALGGATLTGNNYVQLNTTNASTGTSRFGDYPGDLPTSTAFTVKTQSSINASGGSYVAYLFAGGESTAATARSIDQTPNAHLTIGDHSDIKPGTNDFTLEAWIKPDSLASGAGFWRTIGGLTISKISSGNLAISTDGSSALAASHDPELGQWTHVAVCRSGSTIRMFYNGEQVAEGSNSVDYGGTGTLTAGATAYYDGAISNLRLVTGTALYTSSFRPPTEPLTNITNTKLLICNNSDPEDGTVLPTTINNSSAVASSDSPFDDPAGFVFGDSKEGIIKCGSYVGNGNGGSADGNVNGPKITLGFEPAWLLIKRTSASEDWQIYDCMRGMPSNTGTKKLAPNNNDSESGDLNYLRLSADGFQLATANQQINADGDKYIYTAIRRSDGYVGKPVELGTGVLAMDTSNAQTTIPCLDSNFIVDFALVKKPSASEDWSASGRLMSGKYLIPNNTNAEANGADYSWDSNVGWGKGLNSANQSWMFKRHAGMDVVCYDGNSVAGRQIPHSLSKTPEMVWCKMRDHVDNWHVYHLGANGGSNPQDYMLKLNSNEAEANTANFWNDTAPTSTHFTIGSDGGINSSSRTYIALLFSSVSGISKCGFYTGNGAYGTNTISTGFAPRFVIIKQTDSAKDWVVLDTTRGWASGSDKYLLLNKTDAEANWDHGAPTSTGFTLGSDDMVNGDTNKYVYYAHA